MKVVVNKRYGGFSLSREAFEALGFKWDNYGLLYDRDIQRNDPRLVEVVERLGNKAASGICAKLEVVEIPDDVDWVIVEHDGFEHIAEKHRTW